MKPFAIVLNEELERTTRKVLISLHKIHCIRENINQKGSIICFEEENVKVIEDFQEIVKMLEEIR